MEFKDRFVEKYRVALHAARSGDSDATVAGLEDLRELFAEQYDKDNGDNIVTKAKLSYWRDTFGTYADIVRTYGLRDSRVLKLFGIDGRESSSISDLAGGGGTEVASPVPDRGKLDGAGDINIDGILPPEAPAKSDAAPEAVPPTPAESHEPDEGASEEPADGQTPHGGVNGTDGPMFVPVTLRDFIGQQHIVRVLLKEIAIAKNKGIRHLDNILLFGNPGLGKTTLMELIAKELGVRFELLDCSQFRNSQQSLKALQNFFMRVARDNEPVVIALDEIHMLTPELQSSLLTLLNNRVYVSPLDVNGQNKRIPIDEFTFIGASTDDDKVLDTIKNRCLRLKFQLVDYTPEELSRIYKNKVAARGLTISDEAVAACVPRSRGAIRYVNSIVDGLDSALYNDDGVRVSTHIELDTALNYFKEKGIDPIGLEAKDLEILNVIGQDPSGAISADVLSARVGLDTRKYQSEYERYLIKIGFINVSGRGRSLTEKAIQYLNLCEKCE